MKAKAPNLLHLACHKSFVPARLSSNHGAQVETLFSAAHRRVAPAQHYRAIMSKFGRTKEIQPSSSSSKLPVDIADTSAKDKVAVDDSLSFVNEPTNAEPPRSSIFEPAPSTITTQPSPKHTQLSSAGPNAKGNGKFKVILGRVGGASNKKMQGEAPVAGTNNSAWKKLFWRHHRSGKLTIGAGAA